ncbi:MAG: oligosaccharide flippase family protein [Lachnospiraceae bacterium]|nr:oligosaccharide flippase family protein [Lachnospiraceae bacterium]
MQTKKISSQNATTILNILSTVILQGLAFISSPYFSRTLGTANFGIVSVYTTWVQVVSIVFGLRINGVLIMGQNEYPEEKQKGFQSSIMFLSIVTYAFFSLVTIGITGILLQSNFQMVLLILLHGFGQCCVSFANSKFTNEFKADANFMLSVLMSVSTIILSVILIRNTPSPINYWGRIYGEAIPYLIVGVIITAFVLARGKIFIDIAYWKFSIPLAVPMVFHTLAGIVLNQSDRVMLQSMTTDSVVGIYSLAYTFSNVLFVCWSALNNSWVPFFYEYMRRNQLALMKKKAMNYTELFCVVTCGFMLLTPEVYHIFASEDYWSGTSMIPLLAIGTFFVFLYSFPVNYEIFYKKTKMIAYASVFGAGCNILLNYFLIKIAGGYGAAIATLLSYILQFILHHINAEKISRKNEDYPFKITEFLPYVLIITAICLLCTFSVPGVIRWIMALSAGAFEVYRMARRKSIF